MRFDRNSQLNNRKTASALPTPNTLTPSPKLMSEGVRVLGVGNAEAVLRLLSCEFLSNLIHRFPIPYTQNPTPYPFSVCDRSTAPAARRISERGTSRSISIIKKLIQPEMVLLLQIGRAHV